MWMNCLLDFTNNTINNHFKSSFQWISSIVYKNLDYPKLSAKHLLTFDVVVKEMDNKNRICTIYMLSVLKLSDILHTNPMFTSTVHILNNNDILQFRDKF